MAEKNPAARSSRTERMTFLVTPTEKQYILDVAKYKDVPISQYLRDVVLFQARSATGTIFHQAMPTRKPNGS